MKSPLTTLPVFPLSGALLLPGGYLPLNIFEPRYINMVDDALRSDRMIGMIQPRTEPDNGLYSIGCAGKITSFHETSDGRYLITLTGKWRFKAGIELETVRGYRRFEISWPHFDADEAMEICGDIEALTSKLNLYFSLTGMDAEIPLLDQAQAGLLLSMLCMVCPFSPSEKQALLEAKDNAERYELLSNIIDMAVQCKGGYDDESVRH